MSGAVITKNFPVKASIGLLALIGLLIWQASSKITTFTLQQEMQYKATVTRLAGIDKTLNDQRAVLSQLAEIQKTINDHRGSLAVLHEALDESKTEIIERTRLRWDYEMMQEFSNEVVELNPEIEMPSIESIKAKSLLERRE